MARPGRADGPRSRLEILRQAAVERHEGLVRGFRAIVEATSDVATDDEHDPEGHTIAWERQQHAALIAETEDTLARIDDALRRLDEGDYGVCASCGGHIAEDRLDALPDTRSCIACAADAG